MLSDDLVDVLRTSVQQCDEARERLEATLDDAATRGPEATTDPSVLTPAGEALADWCDAQRQFMQAVDASGASNPATAALLLKANHGVDASNARCGLPGTDVDGATQPAGLDLSGSRGSVLIAATESL
jgi:hypothetical protein